MIDLLKLADQSDEWFPKSDLLTNLWVYEIFTTSKDQSWLMKISTNGLEQTFKGPYFAIIAKLLGLYSMQDVKNETVSLPDFFWESQQLWLTFLLD